MNRARLINLIIFLILLVPIFLYLYQFAHHLSPDHQRWAEFGSFIGGTYTAILTALVLLVLIRQTKNQEDQICIQKEENRIDYYLKRLDDYINSDDTLARVLPDILDKKYAQFSKENLLEPKIKKDAMAIYSQHPKIFNFWSALYPVLIELNKGKELPYKLSFHSSINKIQSVLGVGICIGLDHLYFCCADDPLKGNYFFSRTIGK